MNISTLNDEYAVAAQIQPADVAELADAGFVAVICNRPDGEEPGQPAAADIATACVEAGIAFHHIPVTTPPFAGDAIDAHRRVLEESDGPVLGYCRSGARSKMIWECTA